MMNDDINNFADGIAMPPIELLSEQSLMNPFAILMLASVLSVWNKTDINDAIKQAIKIIENAEKLEVETDEI